MRRFRIVSVAAAVVAVAAHPALAPIHAQQVRSIGLWPIGYAAVDPALEGVWRSRGYGWIWDVKDGRVQAYEESGTLCLKSSRRKFDLDDAAAGLEMSPDEQTITILMNDDQYRYAFDRIDALPSTCNAKPQSDPISVFNAVVETFTAHYAFFDARKIDWDTAVQTERSKITAKTKDLQLFKAISRLLSNFRDSHVSLEGVIGDDELEYYPGDDPELRVEPRPDTPAIVADDVLDHWNPRAAEVLLGDTAVTAVDDNVAYGLIDGDIGYLAIRSMAGYSQSEADRALRKAAKLFEGTTALIVDVSANDGGHDWIARAIAGHFTASRTPGYFKYPGDFGDSERQAIYVEPNGDRPYTGAIYLMAGRDTISAAEIFVLSMRALPNVTQIGEPTDGSLSDNLSKPLPNGWALSLSNEVYLDSSGLGWEGLGIPPQIPLRIESDSEDATRRDVAAARRVVDRIRSLATQAGSASAGHGGANP